MSKNMDVTVYGAGYVGLVTAVCLAHIGHQVVCLEIEQKKLACLQQGDCPIYEPALQPLLKEQLAAGRIVFTDDIALAVNHATLQFVAVGTPSNDDGSSDLSYVMNCVRNIAQHMQASRIIVTKSTVPVGSNSIIRQEMQAVLDDRGMSLAIEI